MKCLNKFSLWLNLVLLAALAFALNQWRKAESEQPPAQPVSDIASVAATAPAPQSAPEPPPFRWSQLESADYRAYIANLRAIGCPQKTVRDIITADVGDLYAGKRQELGLEEAPAGPWSRLEQNQLLASLLGAPEEAPPASKQPTALALDPVMPLALKHVDLSALGLSEGQKEAVAEVRDQFIADIGGAHQDPSDPAYRKRWLKAQSQSDDMLRGMLGASAYMNYQLEAQ